RPEDADLRAADVHVQVRPVTQAHGRRPEGQRVTTTSSGNEPAPAPSASASASEAAQLAVVVLEAEAEREAQQASAQEPVLFANDLLPGVGEEHLSLGQALRTGGMRTFVV